MATLPQRTYIDGKQPNEIIGYTLTVNPLPSGVTISTATAAGFNLKTGEADDTILMSTSGTISGADVSIFTKSGVSGTDYRIRVTVTLSDSQVFYEDLILPVRSLA